MSFRTPKYRFHKGSGQALVQINGTRIYLGKHGTSESKERYRQAVAEWLARELVLETVWRALCAVQGLRFGEARETDPVKPTLSSRSRKTGRPEDHIVAIEPYVTPQIWAMVNFQLWSACRPGEACVVRAIDINMQGEIWEYRPHTHKAEHHQKDRVVYLGSRAQEIVKPWLKADLHAYSFSPREAKAWYQAQRAKNRKTPKSPSQYNRRPKPNPKRAPGDRYARRGGPSRVAAKSSRSQELCAALSSSRHFASDGRPRDFRGDWPTPRGSGSGSGDCENGRNER